MEFKQLKALITVAEVGSVTRAAELLDLVQPAVTRQIRTLEDELGVTLFERSRQGMRLTEAGEIMVDRARLVLDDLRHALMAVQQPPGQTTGTVNIGLPESTADLLGPPVAATIRRDHPGVRLCLSTASSGHLQEWLDNGTLDLALLYAVDDEQALNTHPLARDNLWVVAPSSAGLRPDDPIPFALAAQHPLVLPPVSHALRTLIDGAAADAEVTADVVVEADSLRLRKQLVLTGLGWTILPGAAVIDEVADESLCAAPLCDPEIWCSIVVATQRAVRTPPAVRAVARALSRQAKAVARQGRWRPATLHCAGRTQPKGCETPDPDGALSG
ncbi:LysR family transcriptional regulator [Yinghuangia sp. YIM S10712]|uniref:LysR family transcriptional regulator n=1 Tax=Yinghuangia sp. YIM S10712 TaxID=3436930 RepID=UPI003F53AAA9